MSKQIQKSIIQTLAFWDIFEYPLTSLELYYRLFSIDSTDLKLDYTDFLNELERITSLPGAVERSRGFYFLPGREKNVDIRQLKVKLVEEKMKIAKRGIKKLAKIPFVRAVFVCNTTAMGVPDEDSDIDVLVIVRKGRIWLVRFLAILILSLFGLRRTKTKIKNRICLSFYVADDSLNLEKIAIKDDVYLIYWIDSLIPVYDPDNLHQGVLKANQWVKKYSPNGFTLSNNCILSYGQNRFPPKAGFDGVKKFLERMWVGSYGDLIEKQAKGIQQAKMKMNYTSVQNQQDTRVVVSDEMLKFHETDRREEYREKWLSRCKNF